MGELQQFGAEARLVDGTVKWFDPAKGFGFIVADETNGDILLHANVARDLLVIPNNG